MRLSTKALFAAPIFAVAMFLVACSSHTSSLPAVAGGHGVARMRHATIGAGITQGNKYRYQGCVIYGNQTGTGSGGDPYANANISGAGIDSNSSSVLSALNSQLIFSSGSDAGLEIVNIATSSTTTYTAHSDGFHSGPLTLPAPSGYGATGPVPWSTSPQFYFEGSFPSTCGGGDCHWTTLNKSTCLAFQGNASAGGFVSGVFSTDNGFIDDLSQSYSSQFANKSDNWSVAGIPGLGFADFGEDFALTAINHPIQIILPIPDVQNVHVNLSPVSGGADGSCSGGDSACMDYGDILRLKSSVTCPADAKAALVCNQLKTFGAIVSDTEGSGNTNSDLRFGLDISGNDDTDSQIFSFLTSLSGTSSNPTFKNNFDIVTRGALVP